MADAKKFEKQFFSALRDIFVGAKVEGDSGYVNLLRIKSRYYEQGVFPQLQKDIQAALLPFPDFREELFDKLFTFFQRYFSESGSIYFRYTALHQNVYEKVYTDDRDVILFWKTHMLYYVKTDRIFTSLNVEVDGVQFFFDAGKMTLKKSNEKRAVIYTFRKAQADGTLVFETAYSEKGKATKVDDILKEIKKAGRKVSDETLNKAMRVFEKQSEVDYFINKDARAFLQEQFDLWMYQYLFAGQNVWAAERLAQLQALKGIAYKVIDFISQFEDELVKIWNKPKFVRNSHYVLTLDKLAGSAALEKLLAHSNLAQQVEEWRELGMIGGDFRVEMLTQKDLVGDALHPQYQYLPIDTRYFVDLELEILGIFENLDAELDGWLVHSENYQALNSLQKKFINQVQVIYIDPPYNTDASPIIYVNNFRNSSWTSMMHNRLLLSKSILCESGFVCATIDDNEQKELHHLIEDVFGRDNIVGTVGVRVNPSGRPTLTGFALQHEYAIFARKNETSKIRKMKRTEDQMKRFSDNDNDGSFEWRNLRREGSNSDRLNRRRLYYPIITNRQTVRIPTMKWNAENEEWIIQDELTENEVVIYPLDDNGREKTWRWGHERILKDLSLFTVKVDKKGKYNVYYKNRPDSEGTIPPTMWVDAKYSATEHGTGTIKHLFGLSDFTYPKSVYAVEDCIDIAGLRDDDAICLDFFAGSGTTAHAVMNLNRSDGGKRKYILVEMGEHFWSVILPRIKKVAFSSSWKDGKANGGQGISHFIKYYDLEQYEEVLRSAQYADADLFNNPYEDPYHRYVFLRDLKMLHAMEIDAEQNKVHFHPERLYPDAAAPGGTSIDLAETLSQRRGKWIKRITVEHVEFQDGEKISLSDPDWQVIKPLVWWQ